MSEHQAGDAERLERLRARVELENGEAEWLEGLLNRLAETEAQNKRLREALLKANGRKPTMSTKLRDALYE